MTKTNMVWSCDTVKLILQVNVEGRRCCGRLKRCGSTTSNNVIIIINNRKVY